MNFTKPAPGIRKVQTNHGDTLRRIALRELGDASRWTELATLNNLRPPYIVNTTAELLPNVMLAGETINIPAPYTSQRIATDEEGVFLKDILLSRGKLTAANGDLVPVKGEENFKQALSIRVTTRKGELMFHPTYGCYITLMRGKEGSAANNALSAFYVRSAVLEDDRVSEVLDVEATLTDDGIKVEADVQPISDRVINLIAVIR